MIAALAPLLFAAAGSIAGAASVQAPPRPLVTLDDADLRKQGIRAELFALPAGAEARGFAVALAEASGLTPWNGRPIDTPAGRGPAAYAIAASDGREVDVYYAPGRLRACRLTLARGGFSTARYRAYRWCAEQLGFAVPDRPRPPVAPSPPR